MFRAIGPSQLPHGRLHDTDARVVAPPFSIESALDAYVLDESEDRPPDGKWHPSSMFACERKAIYQVRGVPEDEPISARLRRIFFLGTNFHQITQTAIARIVDRAQNEVVATYAEVGINVPLLNIDGHGDAVVIFADGSWDLIELKSINEWGLKSVVKSGIPKAEHTSQALTYQYCLSRYPWTDQEGNVHPPLGLNGRVRIAYLGKDAMDVAEFFVYPTRSWDEEFEAYLAKLQRYKQDGAALPPRLPDQTKYPCNWCSFKTTCWTRDPEGVDL